LQARHRARHAQHHSLATAGVSTLGTYVPALPQARRHSLATPRFGTSWLHPSIPPLSTPPSAAAAAPAANPFAAAAAANPFAPAAPAAAAAAAAAPLEKPFYDADDEKVALLLAELEKSRAHFGAEPRLLERLQRVLYAYRKKGNLDSYAFRVRAPAGACDCVGRRILRRAFLRLRAPACRLAFASERLWLAAGVGKAVAEGKRFPPRYLP
jgi:hypothetical protein